MKKLIILFVVVAMLALPMTVYAGPFGIVENYPIAVPKVSPTVDGNIDAAEGWSEAARMNYNTLGFFWSTNPLTFDADVYFTYDNNNLYYAATIREGLSAIDINGNDVAGINNFIYSTYVDESRDSYGFDGDVFGLSLDPLGGLMKGGLTGKEDYAPRYLIGLFEGDIAKMYRDKTKAGDITDQVQVSGHKTSDGWTFEAAISWDMIIEDIESISYGDVVLNKSDILKNGSLIRAAAMYVDRFYDEEAYDVATWGCFITVPKTLPNGTPGEKGSGGDVKSMGLKLFIDAVPGTETTGENPNETHKFTLPEDAPAILQPDGTDSTNKASENNNTSNNMTTKAANKNSSSGMNSAQTFDIGISVAMGVLLTSAIGFYAVKKRK